MPVRQIATHLRRVQKPVDVIRIVERVVDAETDVGREFQVDLARDFAAQNFLCRSSAAMTGALSPPPSGMT